MTQLHQISVRLSDGQKKNLARAYKRKEEVKIRLGKNATTGSDTTYGANEYC